MKTAPYPPYSPDIAPSDFSLFGCVKESLVSCSFVEAEELFEVVRWILTSIKKWLCKRCFSSGPAEEMHPNQWRAHRISKTGSCILDFYSHNSEMLISWGNTLYFHNRSFSKCNKNHRTNPAFKRTPITAGLNIFSCCQLFVSLVRNCGTEGHHRRLHWRMSSLTI
jgi:hypothetical protein